MRSQGNDGAGRGAAARFHIERREVLEQRRAEKKKLTAPQDVRATELVVGTRSSCGLVLDDPIAAERHCALSYEGGRFILRDVESASGTFLNGVRIEGDVPVSDGDRVALGVSILELALDPASPETLTVGVREGAFFYTMKKRGEFESDADEWVRSEVTFGRTPKLRLFNIFVGVAGIAGAAWLMIPSAGRATLQPGALGATHAALFSASPPTDPSLAFMVEIAQEEGCSACHGGFERPGAVSCGKCHVDLVATATEGRAHPFGVDDSLDCVVCHQEHHGAVPPPDTLKPESAAALCVDCHGDAFDAEEDLIAGLAHAEATYDLSASSSAPVMRVASQGFEAFRHGAHSAIECATCHVETPGERGRDFTYPSFEGCMECHSAELVDDGTESADRPKPEHRWTTAWHGSGPDGAQCRTCHVEPFSSALATIERIPRAGVAFDLGLRGHGEFHSTPPLGPGDCMECHKSGVLLNDGQALASRAFRHDQHLTSLAPSDDMSVALVNGQCAECHTDIAASGALVTSPATYLGPSVDACATCHEEAGSALIGGPGTALATGASLALPDFPHDLHGEVEGGCFACHEFGPDPTGFADPLVPTTPADVVSCVRCHVRTEGQLNLSHESIGGGDCDACHTPRGGASSDAPMAAVFYGPQADPIGSAPFPHTLEAHKGASCVECHGDPTTDEEVHSPSEGSKTCRECHARNRFHWR